MTHAARPDHPARAAVLALVVDDEPKIRDLARRYLEADGFAVLEAAEGEAALGILTEDKPDIVVLDITLPGLNGLELLRCIRLTSAVPIVMLTARDEEIDKVLALTSGADDYVTKPFGGRELAARLRAILRRLQPRVPSSPGAGAGDGDAPEDRLVFPGITIDPSCRSVHTAVGAARVTALDYDLLLALARHPGMVLSRRQLLATVWDDDAYVDERVVDVHIRRLRAKVDDPFEKKLIQTVRGKGYVVEERP